MMRQRVRSTARVGFLVSVIAVVAVSACGKDEAASHGKPSGGSATVAGDANANAGEPGDVGSSGDSFGLGGASAGNAGMDGGGGLMPGVGSGTVGRACISSTECAPGLSCITETDTRLAGGAPPHGMCSAACLTDKDCPSANAFCYPFTNDRSFCVEACAFGGPPLGSAKCHNRQDFACVPAALAQTNQACVTTATCRERELCVGGFCALVLPACLPSCRGDLDCAAGLFCDQSFLAGTCVKTPQTGKRVGEACTVPGVNQPSEPDECLGFCQADDAGSDQGHCVTTCGLGGACGFDSASKKFDGACLSLTQVTGVNPAAGDYGLCTPTCSCGSDCHDPTVSCLLSPAGPLPDSFSAPGVCLPPARGDTVIDCNGGAPSGTGGEAAGGSSGFAGFGGAP